MAGRGASAGKRAGECTTAGKRAQKPAETQKRPREDEMDEDGRKSQRVLLAPDAPGSLPPPDFWLNLARMQAELLQVQKQLCEGFQLQNQIAKELLALKSSDAARIAGAAAAAPPVVAPNSSAGSPTPSARLDAPREESSKGGSGTEADAGACFVGMETAYGKVRWTCRQVKPERAECIAVCKRLDGFAWKMISKGVGQAYFVCETHVDCAARLKVHTFRNQWLVSATGVHANDRRASPKTSSANDNSGVRERHENKRGPRRGIAQVHDDRIKELHAAGRTPKDIERILADEMQEGDIIPDNEQIAARLRQIRVEEGRAMVEADDVELYNTTLACPRTMEEFSKLEPKAHFTLPFKVSMVDPGDERTSLTERGLWNELVRLENKCIIVSGPTMMRDFKEALDVYDGGLPIGTDGVHVAMKGSKQKTVLITLGVKSNVYDSRNREAVQEFVPVARIWHHGETIVGMVALLCSLRYHVRLLFGVKDVRVSIWNSDSASAFVTFQCIMLKDAKYAPCAIHKRREVDTILKLPEKDEDKCPDGNMVSRMMTILWRSSSTSQFENTRRVCLTHWLLKQNVDRARRELFGKYYQAMLNVTALPFHCNLCGMPGQVPYTQSIESHQKKLRHMGVDRSMSKAKMLHLTLAHATKFSQIDRLHDGVKRAIHCVTTVTLPVAVHQMRSLCDIEVTGEAFHTVSNADALQNKRVGDVYLMPRLYLLEPDKITKKRQRYGTVGSVSLNAESCRRWFATRDPTFKDDGYTLDKCVEYLDLVDSFVLVEKVLEIEMIGWPTALKRHVTENLGGLRCSCVTFNEKVHCGHVYYMRWQLKGRPEHLGVDALQKSGLEKSSRKPRDLSSRRPQSERTERTETKPIQTPSKSKKELKIAELSTSVQLTPPARTSVIVDAEVGAQNSKGRIRELIKKLREADLVERETAMDALQSELQTQFIIPQADAQSLRNMYCHAGSDEGRRECPYELHPALLKGLLKIDTPEWWGDVFTHDEAAIASLQQRDAQYIVKKPTGVQELCQWPFLRQDLDCLFGGVDSIRISGTVLENLFDIIQHEARQAGHNIVILHTKLFEKWRTQAADMDEKENLEQSFLSTHPHQSEDNILAGEAKLGRMYRWWLCEKIFVPAFIPPAASTRKSKGTVGHWVLLAIRMDHAQTSFTTTTYDPLGGPQSVNMKTLHDFWHTFFAYCVKQPVVKATLKSTRAWKHTNKEYPVPPQQPDSKSCGFLLFVNVFLLAFGVPKLKSDTYTVFHACEFIRKLVIRMFARCIELKSDWADLYDNTIIDIDDDHVAGRRENGQLYAKYLPDDCTVREYLFALYWVREISTYKAKDPEKERNVQTNRCILALRAIVPQAFNTDGTVNMKKAKHHGAERRRETENPLLHHIIQMKDFFVLRDEKYVHDWCLLQDGLLADELKEWQKPLNGWRGQYTSDAIEEYERRYGRIRTA